MPYFPFGQYGGKITDGKYIPFSRVYDGTAVDRTFVLGGENGSIRSENFVSGSAGWSLFSDGTAVFSNATFRGDIFSSNWNGGSDLSGGADGTATAGFFLDSSVGAAQFKEVYAEGGELGDLSVLGVLTMGSGGEIKTASSGQRISITNGLSNTVQFYSAQTYEDAPPYIQGSYTGGAVSRMELILSSGTSNTTAPAVTEAKIALYSKGTSAASWIAFQAGAEQTPLYLEGTQARFFPFDNSTQVLFPAGSAAAPGISFDDDPDTGIFNRATNAIGFTIGGTEQWSIGASGNMVAQSSGVQIQASTASASLPSYTFSGDTDTGFYGSAANNISVATAGVQRWTWGTGYYYSNGGTAAPALSHSEGSASSPAFTFAGDSDTGMYRFGANLAGFAGGGNNAGYIGHDGTNSLWNAGNLPDIGNVYTLRYRRSSTSGSRIQYELGWYSSLRSHKKNITELRRSPLWRTEWYDDITPYTYIRKSTKGREFGFIMEDLWDVSTFLSVEGNEKGESPDEVALMAVTVDAVQDLRRRVAELEAKLAELTA